MNLNTPARPAPAGADLRETVADAIYGQMLPAFLTPTTAYLILTAVMDVLAPVLAARDKRIRELEQEAGAAVGTAGALRARVLELEMRENARNERIAELEKERNWAFGKLQLAEIRVEEWEEKAAALRAQLAATTAPHRAADRLAADARPTGGGQ